MTTIPTREDINPISENLDELTALQHFQGKSRSEAAKIFFEYPAYYEEDLKWMGSKAFAFYFPSIEPYLLSEESKDDSDIINALIGTLQFRLEQDPLSIMECQNPALGIINYISDNIAKFNVDTAVYGNIANELNHLIYKIQIMEASNNGKDTKKRSRHDK